MDWLNSSLPAWSFTSIPWIIGLLFVLPAALSVMIGQTTVRGRSAPIYRSEEPKTFWFVVGLYALLAFLLLDVAILK